MNKRGGRRGGKGTAIGLPAEFAIEVPARECPDKRRLVGLDLPLEPHLQAFNMRVGHASHASAGLDHGIPLLDLIFELAHQTDPADVLVLFVYALERGHEVSSLPHVEFHFDLFPGGRFLLPDLNLNGLRIEVLLFLFLDSWELIQEVHVGVPLLQLGGLESLRML